MLSYPPSPSVPDREELPAFHTPFPHKLALVLGSVLSPHALSHTFFMSPKYHGTGSCSGFGFSFCSLGLAVWFLEKGAYASSCAALQCCIALLPNPSASQIPPLRFAPATIHTLGPHTCLHPRRLGSSSCSPACTHPPVTSHHRVGRGICGNPWL